MKNKYILILLLALTGCKYPFDLDQKDVKPMAVVRAYMCADSAVTINIHKIVPLSQLVTADTTLINPCYSLRCNGMDIQLLLQFTGTITVSGKKIRIAENIFQFRYRFFRSSNGRFHTVMTDFLACKFLVESL